MGKIARFLFETDFGPFIAWWMVAAAFFALLAVSQLLGVNALVLTRIVLLALGVVSMIGVAAFLYALWHRRWNRAIGQFLLGVISLPLFCLGFPLSLIGARAIACATPVGARCAIVTNEAAALEFSVEFHPSHPFLAEYGKCVVFPSGKRIGVWPDTGGAGAFAVYRLPTGEYYLVDGLEHDFMRNDYRVNTTNETVEMMYDETWVKIPDGSLAVTGGGVSTVNRENRVDLMVRTANGEKSVSGGIPAGDSLKGRRYLGLLHPSGRFEPGDGDPFADIIEPEWSPVKLNGAEVPFLLECKRWKGSHHYRLAFASGARIALDSNSCIGEGGYSLYALEDGRYHLLEARKKDVSWRKEWRIDAADEVLEVLFKDRRGKHGDLWIKIPTGAITFHNSIGISGGEKGKPLDVSIDVNTKDGKVTGHDFVPAGDSPSNARFLGIFRPPDDDPRPGSRNR